MKSKTKITIYVLGAVVFLALLIVGTIFDLSISKAIADLGYTSYYSTNTFAMIFETFGETVLYILIDISLFIIFQKFKNKPLNKTWLNILILCGCILLSVGVTAYAIYKIVHYLVIYIKLDIFLSTIQGKIILIAIGISLLLAIFSLTNLISEENIEKLFKWAIAVLVVAVVSNGIAQVTKYIFSRARFRAIFYEDLNPDDYFMPWFAINNKKFASTSIYASDYFKSFPSGHSCAATSVFLLCLIPCFVENARNKKFYILVPLLCTLYTSLVMASRIVAGAHYFTDVLIGATITIVCILLYRLLFIKDTNKTQKATD